MQGVRSIYGVDHVHCFSAHNQSIQNYVGQQTSHYH